jgi:hypothetical protein
MKLFFKSLLVSLLCILASTVNAQTERFGDYVVYYSVVNSTFVTPEIADQYGITRGDRNAFLNISVQKSVEEGLDEPVTAVITGVKQNMLQQQDAIEFREVTEGTAIYYIGEFRFSNAEPVLFRLEITPEGESRPFELEWNTRVYINN